MPVLDFKIVGVKLKFCNGKWKGEGRIEVLFCHRVN
jgi:hypothetical protein